MVILTNIIRLTDSMDDRILVVYGAGHNKLLNQLAKESDFYTVESPLKYLKSKK
jgi:pheromone shutdown protein TraB